MMSMFRCRVITVFSYLHDTYNPAHFSARSLSSSNLHARVHVIRRQGGVFATYRVTHAYAPELSRSLESASLYIRVGTWAHIYVFATKRETELNSTYTFAIRQYIPVVHINRQQQKTMTKRNRKTTEFIRIISLNLRQTNT